MPSRWHSHSQRMGCPLGGYNYWTRDSTAFDADLLQKRRQRCFSWLGIMMVIKGYLFISVRVSNTLHLEIKYINISTKSLKRNPSHTTKSVITKKINCYTFWIFSAQFIWSPMVIFLCLLPRRKRSRYREPAAVRSLAYK